MIENLEKLAEDYWAGRISLESFFAQLPFQESIARIPLAMLKDCYADKDILPIELRLGFAYSLRLTRDVSSELYQEYKDAKEKLIEVSHSTHPGLKALALKQLHQISAR